MTLVTIHKLHPKFAYMTFPIIRSVSLLIIGIWNLLFATSLSPRSCYLDWDTFYDDYSCIHLPYFYFTYPFDSYGRNVSFRIEKLFSSNSRMSWLQCYFCNVETLHPNETFNGLAWCIFLQCKFCSFLCHLCFIYYTRQQRKESLRN